MLKINVSIHAYTKCSKMFWVSLEFNNLKMATIFKKWLRKVCERCQRQFSTIFLWRFSISIKISCRRMPLVISGCQIYSNICLKKLVSLFSKYWSTRGSLNIWNEPLSTRLHVWLRWLVPSFLLSHQFRQKREAKIPGKILGLMLAG